MEIQERVSLAPLTTFGIGGAARYFVEVRSEEEIREALAWANVHNVPHRIIAGGSNLLVPDEGINALVIKISGSIYGSTGTVMEAEAGCNLLSLVRASAGQGLSGWERLAGIPGTLGGAIRGNAGAFGTEIKDVVSKVRAMHKETGAMRTFSNPECIFSYRNSFFKQHPEWIILSAHITLAPADSTESVRLIEETILEREKRHIQNIKAAGSYFMNPVAPESIRTIFEKEKGVVSHGGRVPAGWLIEKAGLKGACVGGAIASIQHPNYIVNVQDATAAHVRTLANTIKKAVEGQFNILLTEEVCLL